MSQLRNTLNTIFAGITAVCAILVFAISAEQQVRSKINQDRIEKLEKRVSNIIEQTLRDRPLRTGVGVIYID